MKKIANMTLMLTIQRDQNQYFSHPEVLGSFIDNHDTPRALDQMDNDYCLLENGLTFVFFAPGIPILYYGTEQGFIGADENYTDAWGGCSEKDGGDPCNRENLWTDGAPFAPYSTNNPLYQMVTKFNWLRKLKQIHKTSMVELGAGADWYAFVRGDVLIALTNVGNNATSEVPVSVNVTECNLPDFTWANKYLVNLLDNSDVIQVDNNGIASFVMRGGHAKVYHPIVRIPDQQQQSYLQQLYDSLHSWVI